MNAAAKVCENAVAKRIIVNNARTLVCSTNNKLMFINDLAQEL